MGIVSADADTTPLTGTSAPTARRHQRRRQKFGQGSHPDPEQKTIRPEGPFTRGITGARPRRGRAALGINRLQGPAPWGYINKRGARGKQFLGGDRIGTVPVSSKAWCMMNLWRSVELLAPTPLAPTTVRGCVVPQDP